MARVRLIQDALGRPPGDDVQQLHFLQVLGLPAEAPHDLAHELLVHEVLNCVQARVVPRKGKIVYVHDAPDVELGIAEGARARPPSCKPEAL
eukprot:12322382-Alexandrium_andersonii.AAC.1